MCLLLIFSFLLLLVFFLCSLPRSFLLSTCCCIEKSKKSILGPVSRFLVGIGGCSEVGRNCFSGDCYNRISANCHVISAYMLREYVVLFFTCFLCMCGDMWSEKKTFECVRMCSYLCVWLLFSFFLLLTLPLPPNLPDKLKTEQNLPKKAVRNALPTVTHVWVFWSHPLSLSFLRSSSLLFLSSPVSCLLAPPLSFSCSSFF